MNQDMNWLANILTSQNIIPIGIFIVIIIILLSILAKKGIISFNGKGVSISNDSNERKIIRLQLEYTKSELDVYFDDMIRKNKADPDFVELRCRLSKELVYDVFAEAIALNHITTDEVYVQGKLIKIISELSKLDLSAKFTTDEFHQECYKEVKKIIEQLVVIRKYYSKGDKN